MRKSPPNPRLMHALLRSPVPIQPFSEIARQTWSAHVEVTNPDAARVPNFRAAHDWAAATVAHLEKHVS
jgi:hypothetical protein